MSSNPLQNAIWMVKNDVWVAKTNVWILKNRKTLMFAATKRRIKKRKVKNFKLGNIRNFRLEIPDGNIGMG